jgi:hypothetical protein
VDSLTDDQKKKLKRLGLKFAIKSTWNGVNHGAMAVVMNLILTFANIQFFDNDSLVQFVGCLFILIFIMMRLTACQRENVEDFKKEVKKITT